MRQEGPARAGEGEAAEPPFRYTARLAADIESRWQDRWQRERTFEALTTSPSRPGPPAGPGGPGPGPSGGKPPDEVLAAREKLYVLDMFPYPSGSGLHVGHPLGYIATDVYGRYQRMAGRNVLHALGFDAFGLPAEQYAVQTGQHPKITTEANIANMRRQLGRLGLAHDPRRSVATTDVSFYRWTQWIFLQIYNAWYDPQAARARPIADLEAKLASGEVTEPGGRRWEALSDAERRAVVDAHRLAYLADAPVNWCPGLGTVVANEEVTAEGRSERGNFPVFKRNLRQWMMRITAYAERLLDDLELVDWPGPVRLMQRNWIGRSEGARVGFRVEGGGARGGGPAGQAREIPVFTTRPDTLFGATFMVLSPEHPDVDRLVPATWPPGPGSRSGPPPSWTGGAQSPAEAVMAYRRATSRLSDLERQAEGRPKTGVFIGAYATNPATGGEVPVFIADYVLMGYGTGAIMAVPAHDQRDFDFARSYDLPLRCVVSPPAGWPAGPAEWEAAWTGEGEIVNSCNRETLPELDIDGLGVEEAKAAMAKWLESTGNGSASVTYKLRDWLFSRQRYWGEPFPIVYDSAGSPVALPEHMLPVTLPEVDDYSPVTFAPEDAASTPVAPLARNREWVEVTLDLGDGPRPFTRETNTMPQWAGSCWYEMRYLDPANESRFCDPEIERHWMGPRGKAPAGGVDLYVGGVEHAVLHLLYARFWHKVLHDLGHVSSSEPFARLVNQGYILAPAYTDSRQAYVPADEVEETDRGFTWRGQPVERHSGKMGKSLKNSVTPDELYDLYGADTLRLYEMSMGPIELGRPWETRAVVGSFRLLQRLWRNIVDEETGAARVTGAPAGEVTLRLLHKTIAAVRDDLEALRFNTAIARMTELNNHLTRDLRGPVPREVAEPLVLMLAPFAPHVAEELWSRLGHPGSLAYEAFPEASPEWLAEESVTCAVQVGGKLRDKLEVPPGIAEEDLVALALASAGAVRALAGRPPQRVIARPPGLVNIVPGPQR
ncbi:MAG: leucine--tRNA ligase [Acidimicrobiales bacterium]